MKINRTSTAWESIGWDDGPFRVKGGRAIYEGVLFNISTPGNKVKLARLEPILVDGVQRLQEVSRYVDGDTILEFLSNEEQS